MPAKDSRNTSIEPAIHGCVRPMPAHFDRLVASAITAFYYFRLVRVMFFTEPSEESVVVQSEGLSALAILVCALGTIALGVFPGPVLSLLEKIVILIP